MMWVTVTAACSHPRCPACRTLSDTYTANMRLCIFVHVHFKETYKIKRLASRIIQKSVYFREPKTTIYQVKFHMAYIKLQETMPFTQKVFEYKILKLHGLLLRLICSIAQHRDDEDFREGKKRNSQYVFSDSFKNSTVRARVYGLLRLKCLHR